MPKKRKLADGYYESDGAYIVCPCGAWNRAIDFSGKYTKFCYTCSMKLYRDSDTIKKEIAALQKELDELINERDTN